MKKRNCFLLAGCGALVALGAVCYALLRGRALGIDWGYVFASQLCCLAAVGVPAALVGLVWAVRKIERARQVPDETSTGATKTVKNMSS